MGRGPGRVEYFVLDTIYTIQLRQQIRAQLHEVVNQLSDEEIDKVIQDVLQKVITEHLRSRGFVHS